MKEVVITGFLRTAQSRSRPNDPPRDWFHKVRSDDLLAKLCPHVDGVILRDGFHRATFLPQVWEKIPEPVEFLDNLCYKMGVRPDLWRSRHLEVLTYRVQEFHE